MNSGQAVWMGALQGLTEFLPVSSDGHLALWQATHAEIGGSLALDIALHAGTLGAVLIFFGKDILRMCSAAFSRAPEAAADRRRVWLIVLATVPTGIIGLTLKHRVESMALSVAAAGAGFLVSAAWLAGGEWASRRGARSAETASALATPWWHAVVLGVVQGMAVWPGLSRSGSTIAAALLLGWRWEDAGRFSFLMSIPAVAGAILVSAGDLRGIAPAPVAVGVVTAFVVGCLALWLLMKFLAARCLWPFAVYCAGIGLYALLKDLL